MSRSKQEAFLLEERIEKIRKKNEEIKKRYLEVEADKQNAAKLNALVQVASPTEDWPIGGRSPPHIPGTGKGLRSEQKGPHQHNGSNGGSAKCYTLGEQRDGPPRDPVYKFLADTERDRDSRRSQQQPQWRGKSGGRSRGGFTRDRGKRNSPQRGGGRDVPQPEYEAWRAERSLIDNDRISRQRTAEGHWRREWDNEKITQGEENVRRTVNMSRGGEFQRQDNVRHPFEDHKAHTVHDHMRPREGNSSSRPCHLSERAGRSRGTSRESKGNIQSKRYIRAQTHPIQDSRGGDGAHNERSVICTGESLRISVANSSPAPLVKSVKVNAPVVAGTGRVGPRQNLRISYSSQSEDEAPSRRVEVQRRKTSSSNNNKASPDLSISNHTSASASTKPPLPPTGMKQDPKPKRQRAKRLEQGTKLRKPEGKEELNTTEVSKCSDKKEEEEEEETVMTMENCQREIESGGDDSWEDVTTTSGNDSACEELLPHGNMDSTVDSRSAELKSDLPWVVQNSEVKSEMIQNTGANSEMVQKTGMLKSAEEDPAMIQKSQSLQNVEAKLEILQNIEVKSGMNQDTEGKSGNSQKMEETSGKLQHTDVKMEKPQAGRSSLNSELGHSTEISKVTTNSKVSGKIMQEVAQDTLMSGKSTNHNDLEDVSEICFDETHSDTLVEAEEGTMGETVDLEEKENKPPIICREEEDIKTESWDRHEHGEEQQKVDIIQETESVSLSDGVAAVAIVPEEKKESYT